MKKRFFAIIASVAMTVTSVPAITLAADGGQVITETGKGGAVI
jgi:hypothetical protein